MQPESTSLELHQGLPLRNKYTINKQLLSLDSVSTYSEKIYGLLVPVD